MFLPAADLSLPKESLFPARNSPKGPERSSEPHYDNEVYQAFMAGYVKRINDATLRVPIGGIRIGSAKHSRLAQINLHTHIITFSRFAIENVPERGRRYLVIHELSHVKEASHNKKFWQIVAEHEPKYKEIGKELDQAFKLNVRADQRMAKSSAVIQARLFPQNRADDWDNFREALDSFPDQGCEETELNIDNSCKDRDPGLFYPLDSGVRLETADELFDCNGNELGSWQGMDGGIVYGGSDHSDTLDDDYIDHL